MAEAQDRWWSDSDAQEPEALAEALDHARTLDWTDPNLRSETGLRRAFEGMQALAWAGEMREYVAQLAEADLLVDECLDHYPAELWPLHARIAINRLTSRLEPFDPGFFAALPRLLHLLDQVNASELTEQLRPDMLPTVREALVLAESLSTRAAYLGWLKSGGTLDAHSSAEQALGHAVEHELLEGIVAAAERADLDAEVQIVLVQGLATQAISVGNASEGVRWRMRLLELLPTAPGHTNVELADVRFELGQLHFELGEWRQALDAFGQAYDGYVAAGEAFEMHATQAESWMEQAREMAASRAAR
jgi:tetratricopeptide (TPR) repeat protein